MSETYTKLFSSIVHSSVWREPMHIKVVWVTMLALSDKHGYVGASLPGLADASRVSLEQCQEAIALFMAPDVWSRSKEHDGRRIEEADRGWTILNYDRFRDMRDEEIRKEYERERKREQRAKARQQPVPDNSGQTGTVPVVPKSPAVSAQAEAEAEAKAEKEIPPKPKREKYDLPGFREFWKLYPRGEEKFAAWELWNKLKCEEIAQDVIAALKEQLPALQKDEAKFCTYAERWLKKRRWEDRNSRTRTQVFNWSTEDPDDPRGKVA